MGLPLQFPGVALAPFVRVKLVWNPDLNGARSVNTCQKSGTSPQWDGVVLIKASEIRLVLLGASRGTE